MTLGVVLTSAIIFGGIVFVNLSAGIKTVDIQTLPGETQAPSVPFNEIKGGVDILLVGSDDRTGQGAEFGEGEADAEGRLNDVNMLFHLSEDHTSATVVSIPRDTLVDTPECTNDQGSTIDARYGVMMNSILEDGGLSCIVSTVQSMSGLSIEYAAMVQFKGVIEMSNALGGVDVCVEQRIDDPYVGLTLDPGVHSLQGADALKFLRTRHGVGDGSDLTRISNQQVFLSALMRSVKSQDTLTNVTKLYGLARAATQNMTLSSNLNSLDTMVALANALAAVPLQNIAFVRLPVAASYSQPGRVEPTADAEAMWELLRTDQPVQVANDPSVMNSVTPEPSTTAEPDSGASTDGLETEGPTADGTAPAPTPAAPAPPLDGQTADQQTCSVGQG